MRYEEVIDILINHDRLNYELKSMKGLFERGKRELEKDGIKVNIKDKEFIVDLNKLLIAREKTEAQAQARREAREERERIARQRADARENLQRKADKAKAEDEILKNAIAALEQFSRVQKQKDRDEREIAKALHRYRRDMDREQHQARVAQLKEQIQLEKQAAQFKNIFTAGGRPLPVTPSAKPAPMSFNVSSALRAGAGASGALGMYPAAGTMYALANALSMVGASSMTVAAGLSAAAVALPIGVTAGLLAFGKEFNIELAKMSTLMLDASASSEEFERTLDKAADSAVKISAEFNMELVGVVKAFKDALSSGIDVVDLERFARGAATLSSGLGIGLSESTNILTSFKDSYHLTITELSKVNDILFNTVDEGKVNVNDLVNNFGRLLPIGKAAGLSIEDLATGVAVMTRRGLTASQSITSMTQLINGVISPSDKAKRAFDEMGIATGEAAFKGRDLLAFLTEVRAKTGGSGELLGQLFTEERGKRGIAIATDALHLFEKTRESIDEIGTAAVASDRALGNLWDNLGRSIKGITSPLRQAGSDFADFLDKAMYGSAEFQKFMKQNERSVSDTYKNIALSNIKAGENDTFALEKDLVGKVGDIGFKIGGDGNGNQVTFVKNMKEIKEAVAAAQAEYRDSTVGLIRDTDKAFDELNQKFLDALNSRTTIKDPLKDLGKREQQQFNDRATESQKAQIIDLQAELELLDEKIEKEKELAKIQAEKEIASFKAKTFANPLDALERAQAGGNVAEIRAAEAQLKEAQQLVSDFIDKTRANFIKSNAFGPLIEQAEDATNRIRAIQKEAMDSGPSWVRDTLQRAIDDANKEKEKSDREADKTRERSVEDFNRIVERLYKEDVSAFEKAQEEKKKASDKLNRSITKNNEDSAKLSGKIRDAIIDSQIEMRGDDPRAQARFGRMERDEQKARMDRIIESGGSRDEFEAAARNFLNASEAIKAAMSTEDVRRANRNYQEDLNVLQASNSRFDQQFNERSNITSANIARNARGNSVRSASDLAKAAVAEQAAQTEIEKVRLDAEINLTINGTLDDKSKNDIANVVIRKIQASQRNKNTPSDYDRTNRDDSRVTAE